MELGGHHVAVGDLVLVDQTQHLLRQPLVHQDHGVAQVQCRGAEDQHGGVVEGGAADVDVVVLGLQAEHAQEARGERGDDLGRDLGKRPAHALRLARGARGVVHHLAGGAALGHLAGLSLAELGEGAEALHAAQREAHRAREVDLLAGHLAGLGEALRADEDLRAAVLHDVGDLGARQVVVDGRHVEADLHDGQVDLIHLGAVLEHDGDAVSPAEAEGAQAVGDLVGLGQQLAAAPLAAAGVDQSELLGGPLSEVPESEFCHGGLLRAYG